MITKENTALILEQCRADMDALAVTGAAGMKEAMAKAENRVRACTQDWRQASRAVELTFKQEKAVEDARLTGEEKLAQAITEEEDAQTAVETVRRMMEDAANVLGTANSDTARILTKAESVLSATCQRAEIFYNEKRTQRQEIQNAMQRLYATEKAVLYTMAKAERNESEKQLAKIVGEKKLEVFTGEYQVLTLQRHGSELEDKRQEKSAAKEDLSQQIDQAQQQVNQLDQALADAELAYEQQTEECLQHHEKLMSELNAAEESAAAERSLAEVRLDGAVTAAAQREAQSVEADNELVRLRQEAARELAEAKTTHDDQVQVLEDQLEQLRDTAAAKREAYDGALADMDQAQAQAELLRAQADAARERASSAAADEVSVRSAAETASRLASNATKIRESISSESSQLLLHAQEVLLEAAASACQLMEEKRVQRLNLETEANRANGAAVQAERTFAESKEAAAGAKEALDEAVNRLDAAVNHAAARRQELDDVLAALSDKVETRCQEAEAHSAQLRAMTDQAAAGQREAQEAFDQLSAEVDRLRAEKSQADADLEQRLAELSAAIQAEQGRLNVDKDASQARLDKLQADMDQLLEEINGLEREMEDTSRQVDAAMEHVSELIAAGAAAIEEADAEVQRREEVEKEARAEAEEAVASINASSAGYRDDSLREGIAQLTEIIDAPTAVRKQQPDDPAPAKGQEAAPAPEDQDPILDTAGGLASALSAIQSAENRLSAVMEDEPALDIAVPDSPAPAEPAPLEQEPSLWGVFNVLAEEEEAPAQADQPLITEEETPAEADAPLIPEEDEAPAQADQPLIPEEDQATAEADQPLIPDDDQAPAEADAPLIPDEDEAPADADAPLIPDDDQAPAEADAPLIPDDDQAPADADAPLIPDDDQAPADADAPLIPDDDQAPADADQPLIPDDDEAPAQANGSQSEEDLEYTTRMEILGNTFLGNAGQDEGTERPGRRPSDWLMDVAHGMDEDKADDAAKGETPQPLPEEAGLLDEVDSLVPDDAPVPPEQELNIASMLMGIPESSDSDEAPLISEAVLDSRDELELPIMDASTLAPAATVTEETQKKKRRFGIF